MNDVVAIGDTWRSETYKYTTFCGSLYVIISYKFEEKDKIEFVRIVNDGQPDCGGSFTEALADMLTFAIRRIRNEHEAKAIIKNLRYNRCNKYVINKDKIMSCSDAIGRVLQKVLEKNGVKNGKGKDD